MKNIYILAGTVLFIGIFTSSIFVYISLSKKETPPRTMEDSYSFSDRENQRVEVSQEDESPTEEDISRTTYFPTAKATALDADSNVFQKFENTELGFSFTYPENWYISEVYYDPEENHHIALSTFIYSHDYAWDENVRIGGSVGGVIRGNRIGVVVYRIKELQDGYSSVQSILDGTYRSKSYYSQQKKLHAGTISGVEYVSSYEGPSFLVSKFDHSGYEYTFYIQEDENGIIPEDDMETYRDIVASFTVYD